MRATRTLVCPILVGRDDLLDLADRRISEVAAGRGQLLLLAGEAGVGKTRFLGAIERRAAAAGFRVARGGTYPSDLQVAAAVFIDLGRAMLRHGVTEEPGRALARRLADETPSRGDPHRRRRLLVLDVAEIVAGIVTDGPAIVSLEDLHWSDDLTLEIVEALARQLADLPLLVVGTYRSDELFPRVPMRTWRARLLSQRLAEEVRLSRLSADDTAQMTTLLIETGLPVARDVAAAVHARTDGIPLHVEELLGVLAEGGVDGLGPDRALAVQEADVPETVEDAILARIDPCSSAAKDVATAGAVIGRAFDLDLLSTVLDVSADRLSKPLDELADHFVLLPARTPGRYGFRHALICDAIYDHIPVPERRRAPRATADAAAGSEVGTDAFLALHYERAGRRDEAFAAALRGAARASTISSQTEARELYMAAIRTAPPDLPPGERGRLLEAFGTSAAATDDNEAADDAFARARQCYLEAGEALAASAVVGPRVAVRHLLGDALDVRADALRDALGEIVAAPMIRGSPTDRESDRVRAKLLAGLAAAYMLDRRLDDSIGYATDARRLAVQAGDAATDRNAATTLGACLVFAGRMDEGWALVEEAIAASRADHLEAEAARGYRMIGSCASVLVEYIRAQHWLREGIDFAERVELWNHRHYMAAHLAHVLWATGDWGAADEVARHALADGRGGITTRITALHVLGYVALGRGDLDAATGILEEARELGQRMNELQRVSPALWGLAETARLRGDNAAAAARSEEGFEASEPVRDAAYLYPFLVTGCRAYLGLGDPLAADRWVERVASRLEERGIPGTLPAVDHGRGLVLLAEGSTGKARTALEAAEVGWRDRGRRWEGTWAAIDLARCLLRSNLRVDASRVAASARVEATRLGSPPLIVAADEVIEHAGRRGVPAEPWAPLTAREYEVARLVAEGKTNLRSPRCLGSRPRRWPRHVEHILAKLGAGRRAEIASWWPRSGPPGGTRSTPETGPRRSGPVGGRATLPASRQGPGGVTLHRPEASAGRCEPRGHGGVNVTREPRRQAPDTAPRGHRTIRAAMSETGPAPNQQVVPHPVVRWTSGASDSRADRWTETSETNRAATELPKAYKPAEFEGAIYERWLAADVVRPRRCRFAGRRLAAAFTLIQPPPNITGSLHIGHAQRTAVEDLMVRHARMQGRRTLFLPGLDHASIAAQYVLDRILAEEGESRQSLGRERYLVRMWTFINDTREVMKRQQRRVGASVRLVAPALHDGRGLREGRPRRFERLYRDGLAYRTEALVNWCPGCRTSVSDLEVNPTPANGTLWTVRYHLIDETTGEPDPGETLSVATTARDDPRRHRGRRPPRGPRYEALVGRRVRIPFVDRDVPDHRRLGGRPRIWHGRREDHTGARPRRLRDRPPPRPADDHSASRRRYRRRDGHGL